MEVQRAKVGGLGALAGAIAVAIPTLPTIWADDNALEMCHETQLAVVASYEALVEQVARHSLGHMGVDNGSD